MKGLENLIAQCDSLLRQGLSGKAARLISNLPMSQVERKYRLPLAKICRRTGQISNGLKLLSKIVLEDTPSSPELAEYAVLLQRSGALSEAYQKLARVDNSEAPEALLYRSYVHFARWEFAEAIPLLKEYIRQEPSTYGRHVGQINLAFALIEERQNTEALEILNNLNTNLGLRLQSNAHALRGQILLQEGAFAKARAQFEEAHKLVEGSHNNDRFFAVKWSLILDGLENKSIDAFERLHILAAQHRSWEVSREADLFSLRVEYVRERYVHLYFGTPFTAFRRRFNNELGSTPTQPIYVLGKKSSPRLDLRSGMIDGVEVFNPTSKSHKLLDALLRDLYRPQRIASLFSILFPEEQFNIVSSPHRVRQLITRTRTLLTDLKIPVTIKESSGFYSLNLEGDFSFRIPLNRESSPSNPQLKNLNLLFKKKAFSAKDVKEALQISPATAHRLIHQGLSEGIIVAAGQTGRSLLYRFINSKNLTKAA